MGKQLKGLTIQLVWPSYQIGNKWTKEQVKNWVEQAGGKIIINQAPQLDITHFVCDEGTWAAKKPECESLWTQKAESQAIKAVSLQWLADCLQDQKKLREGPYLWKKLPATTTAKKPTTMETSAPGEVNNILDVISQNAGHIDERDQADIDAHFEAQDAAAKEAQEEERRRIEREKNKVVLERKKEELARGGKSRNQVWAENNHVYRGKDGFPYELLLTKVDVTTNTNERLMLTLYETNKKPHLYACNIYIVATPEFEHYHKLLCQDTTFLTARRSFLDTFKDLTYIEFSERHTQRGFVVNSELAYKDKPWVYRYPLKGPVGDLENEPDPDHLEWTEPEQPAEAAQDTASAEAMDTESG